VWKKARASTPSFAPLSASMRMSPPAQKPRPSLWSTITASTASSSRHSSSASIIASHIGRLSAWIAFGRLSDRRPIRPSVEIKTSSV